MDAAGDGRDSEKTMKLSEKGTFSKAPILAPPHAQALSETVAQWGNVQARTHWFLADESIVDGVDFYLGQEELGHIHLDGEAHVAVGKDLAKRLKAKALAHPFRWSEAFVTFPVHSEAARDHAAWLFSLRYGSLKGEAHERLVRKIEDYQKLDAKHFD